MKWILILLIIGMLCIAGVCYLRINSSEEVEQSTHEKIFEQFGNIGYEKGVLVNGEKIVEYSGDLEGYING